MAERNSGEVILAFLLGGLIGACLGILYAPKTGKEIRRKLRELAEELGEKTEELIEEGKEKAEKIFLEGKDKFIHRKEAAK